MVFKNNKVTMELLVHQMLHQLLHQKLKMEVLMMAMELLPKRLPLIQKLDIAQFKILQVIVNNSMIVYLKNQLTKVNNSMMT